MALTGTSSWAICLPVARTNGGDNPDYELGTAGAGAIQGAGVGSTTAQQQFGAVSLFFTPTSNGTSGAYLGTVQATNGLPYSYSAYVKGSAGVGYMLAVADTSNVLVGSVLFTGGGTWQRYIGSYTEPAGATRRVIVRKANGANAASLGTVYADAWQFEQGSVTTFISGDVPGCTWNGAPHASTSTRSGQTRSGGSVILLADLGVTAINSTFGVGMPPVENSSQSYAILDGAQYQRTRAAARAFTLNATLIGTSQESYHVTRSRIIDALKIDLTTPQQPIRFYCMEGLGTLQIDAVYDSGMEAGQRDSPMSEPNVPLKFIAYTPYWSAPTQEGTALAPFNTFGSANFVVSRDPLGNWGTMGASGSSTSGELRTLFVGTDQRVLAGGSFQRAGGTIAGNLALYDPPTNTWGTFAGGTVSPGFVYDIAQFPNGTILVVGSFSSLGGTTSRHVGFWAGANYGSFGGSASDYIHSASINAYGTAFLGGQFITVGGTTSPNLATLINGRLGSVIGQASGTIDQLVLATTIGLDQTLYFGGIFLKAGGTSVGGVAQWKNGTFGSMGVGIETSSINAMTTMLDGKIAVGGQFGSISGVVTSNVALWNGVGMSSLAQGFGVLNGNAIYAFLVDASNTLYASGVGSNAGAVPLPDGVGKYIGGAWVPLDISLGPGVGAGLGGSTFIYSMAQSPNGTVYLGGDFAGSAIYATVAQLVNTGRAAAYPTVRLRNLGAGP